MMVNRFKMNENVFTRYENRYPDGCICDKCGKKIKPGKTYFSFGKQSRVEARSGPKIKCYSCGTRSAA